MLVLDARSGEELGVSVVPYPSAVIDRELPVHRRAAARRLGAPGSGRLGQGARGRHSGRGRRRRGRARGGGRARGSTSPRARCCRSTADGTPLCTLPTVSRAAPRLAQAVEASRRPAGRRPSQRGGARARRAVPGALRRADLLGVVLPEADRGVVRGPRGLRRLRRLHRGDRLDRLAPDRTRGPPERHRRLQGDVVAGRGAAADRVLRGRLPRVLGSRPRSSARSSCRWAPEPARSPPSARSGWGSPTTSRSPSATSTRGCRCRARASTSPSHVRDRDRHLDLLDDRRPRRGAAARDHRGGARRDPARASTAMRRARRRSGTCWRGSCARWTATATPLPSSRARQPSSRPARPGWSRWTGSTATARSWPTPISPAPSSGSPCTARPARSTARCWSRSPSATGGSSTTSPSTASSCQRSSPSGGSPSAAR